MPTPSRRPLSLALRITALVGLAMALVFAAFAWWTGRSIERHFAEQDLTELQAVVASLSKALESAQPPGDRQDQARRLAAAVAGHHDVFFTVFADEGQVVHGDTPRDLLDLVRSLPGRSVEGLTADNLFMWTTPGRTYRGAVLEVQSLRVIVAVALDFHLRYLAQLRNALWGATVVACLAAILAAWLAVRWGHAPLRRISATMRGVGSEQLHVRLESAQVPLELAELVASFNAMLDRLQDSFQRLSHFSADIAHELRTPVTNLTTETQVVLSKPRPVEAYQEVLYSNLEELERLAKTIGDMLFLAQAEHELSKPEMVDIDLAAELRALFDYFEAWAEEAGVALRLEGFAPPVRGDKLMLRRALSNLLANAIRHTPRQCTITARLATVDSGFIEVQVQNPGERIPAVHLPHLFDRFYRVDPARQNQGAGAGLGLAIVKSIIRAHGGAVAVESTDQVTTFAIRLPVRPG